MTLYKLSLSGRTLLVASVFFLLAASPAMAFKYAVVDLQRVLLESEAGRVAKDLLESATQSKKEELEKKSKDFRDLKDKYDQKASILNDAARQKMERDLQEKQVALQQLFQQYQVDLQKQDSEMTRAILKNIEPIIEAIAATDKFELVLEKTESGILFSPNKVDITDRVIRKYNARKKSK